MNGGRNVKKLFFIIIAVILMLTACQKDNPEKSQSDLEETKEMTAGVKMEHPETLVVYFSATGTTRNIAEKITAIVNADIYEIIPKEPYSKEDLDWKNSESRSTIEQNDSTVRPKIGSEVISLDGYKTIYIGYPIWWGEEPRIMDTFVESYSFNGIKVIPFCTSGGSEVGNSGKNLEKIAGSGDWVEGKRFEGDVSESELSVWIESLK